MTENTTSDVGRATIDAYLDSVEQALLAAHWPPRSDRVQVLQDLETQIADMLAKEPQPLTDEMVTSVIEKLEPASHFAAMYGNGKPQPAERPRSISVPTVRHIRWSWVAAFCFLVPVLGALLELALDVLRIGNGAVLHLSILAGLVSTPWALYMAYNQIRERPDRFSDRDFVYNMIIAYAALVPAFVMIVLIEWTYGLVLIPFGFAAVVYLYYTLLRRFRRRMIDALPPQAASGSASDGGQREAARPIGSAMSAPAM